MSPEDLTTAGETMPPDALAHQFDDLEQQHSAATLGMWVFLATEVMFFGGMFLGYAVYRHAYPQAFAVGSRHMELVLGAVNTAVLLTSSFTMALAVRAAQMGRRRATVGFLLVTICFGLAFLGIKAVEYTGHIREGLSPGPGFHFEGPQPEQVHLFTSFYFVMTGTHAVHMVVGVVLLSVIAWLAWRGRFGPEHHAPVEVSGLYWHFVDMVWIFLFPLFYLIDIHR